MANLATLDRVANVKQYLEVELLSPVREIERSHLRLIAGCLRALECFAVHLVEIL
jgi:hypothetical protein